MRKTRAGAGAIALVWLGLAAHALAQGAAPAGPAQWEAAIRAFEEADAKAPPPKNAVLFIGSSSIRLWTTLAEDFPEHQVVNRGFGGSRIADSVHFAPRIVLPYAPRLIVFYAGGNDIHEGLTPEAVAADFRRFVEVVHASLPKTRIAFVSIAGNPARWSQVDRVRALNRLVEAYTRTDARLAFIDVFPHMLGDDGRPKPGIFAEDQLHMNGDGYRIWTRIIAPHLTP